MLAGEPRWFETLAHKLHIFKNIYWCHRITLKYSKVASGKKAPKGLVFQSFDLQIFAFCDCVPSYLVCSMLCSDASACRAWLGYAVFAQSLRTLEHHLSGMHGMNSSFAASSELTKHMPSAALQVAAPAARWGQLGMVGAIRCWPST